MDRRNFLTAASSSAVLTATANADTDPKPQTAPTAAVLVFEIARQKFGEKLTSEQLAVINSQIAGNLLTGKVLAQTPLTDADEPVLAPSSIYRTW